MQPIVCRHVASRRIANASPVLVRSVPFVAAVALCGITASAFANPAFVERSLTSGLLANQAPSENLEFTPYFVSRMIGAGAIGDFDRDGDPDVLVLSGGTTPDRLFINNGGSFTDMAPKWGVDRTHIGIGACVGDVDGDGWLDIFVTSFGLSESPADPVESQHLLYRNNGDGTFTDIAASAGLRQFGTDAPQGWGPAFGDYDLDGDLDLAVPSWTGGGTRLFRNEGDGTFEDVSAEAGVQSTMPQGFSAAFVDMDGDRYPELLVASDFGGSQYLRNNGDGTFSDLTVESGTGLDGNGMGHVIADFDGDGRQDWYVTSIHTAFPNGPHVPGDGNYLYRQAGSHAFDNATTPVTRDGGWGWGVEAIDLDHDGRLDIVETNGWPLPNGIGETEWLGEPCHVLLNLGDDQFQNITDSCGLDWSGMGRGLVRFDADRDGDQDVIVFAFDDALRYYMNALEPGPDRGWIDIRLDTNAHPRLAPDGFGAEVAVRTGDTWHRRMLTGQSTFASQSELSVHFGLGSARMLDDVRITWNDGSVTTLGPTPVNQHLVIDSGFSSDRTGDGRVAFLDLLVVLSDFGSDDAGSDLDASGSVDLPDLMILLSNWSFD